MDLKQKMIHEAVRVIREDEPKTLSSINKTFRGDVEIIVSKALIKEFAQPDGRALFTRLPVLLPVLSLVFRGANERKIRQTHTQVLRVVPEFHFQSADRLVGRNGQPARFPERGVDLEEAADKVKELVV